MLAPPARATAARRVASDGHQLDDDPPLPFAPAHRPPASAWSSACMPATRNGRRSEVPAPAPVRPTLSPSLAAATFRLADRPLACSSTAQQMAPPVYNEHYDDPDGDLALQCPKGKQSRVKMFKLWAAAEVFDDMLQTGSGGSGDKTADGLPLVKVSDGSKDFGLLLRYMLHPTLVAVLLNFHDIRRCVSPGREPSPRAGWLALDPLCAPDPSTCATSTLPRNAPRCSSLFCTSSLALLGSRPPSLPSRRSTATSGSPARRSRSSIGRCPSTPNRTPGQAPARLRPSTAFRERSSSAFLRSLFSTSTERCRRSTSCLCPSEPRDERSSPGPSPSVLARLPAPHPRGPGC